MTFISALLAAICTVESGPNPRAINVVDGNGASYGKCQIKLSTARDMGFRGHVTELWLNPKTNEYYARKYLLQKLRKYKKVDDAVGAYNRGSVKRAKDGTLINKHYVIKVFKELRRAHD